MSRGVTAWGWATSAPSRTTLIDSIWAVDEKFATTWTGELTVLAVGETMLMVCAPAIMDTERKARIVRERENNKGTLQHFFSASRSSATTHPEFRWWGGLTPSGQSERAKR